MADSSYVSDISGVYLHIYIQTKMDGTLLYGMQCLRRIPWHNLDAHKLVEAPSWFISHFYCFMSLCSVPQQLFPLFCHKFISLLWLSECAFWPNTKPTKAPFYPWLLLQEPCLILCQEHDKIVTAFENFKV